MSPLYHSIAIISIFLLLQPISSSNILAPLLSPFIEEFCKDVACGKGKCKTSFNHSIGYRCECDPGWKQIVSDDNGDGGNLRFLPCVIPNCTVDYSCEKAQTPSPQIKDPPKNTSFFDACNWAFCGKGTCAKSNKTGHVCQCEEGAANLFNMTSFPCFGECSMGMDCASLGISLPNKSSPPTSALTDVNDNHASSVLSGKIFWMVILMLAIALSPWK